MQLTAIKSANDCGLRVCYIIILDYDIILKGKVRNFLLPLKINCKFWLVCCAILLGWQVPGCSGYQSAAFSDNSQKVLLGPFTTAYLIG